MVAYNDTVEVFAETDELLGTAQLVGRADQASRGELWQWRAQLLNTSFEPGVLLQSGQLRIVFVSDGAVGQAF